MKRLTLMTASLSLFACTQVPPSLVPPIVCGFASVLVSQADIPEVEKAFGTDKSPGSRLCKAIGILLTGDETGASEPTDIEEPAELELSVGEDQFVVITVLPPTR